MEPKPFITTVRMDAQDNHLLSLISTEERLPKIEVLRRSLREYARQHYGLVLEGGKVKKQKRGNAA
ncbi:MAG: hypothetical protein GWN84_13170 [Gammaproteobacteria bacterium]|nr:hypothetical protein [Gammaproteobacteria bacterium]NIR83780.1 hypothetical protein [Gammaproteobacteria bacterium]NIU05106.1 hypothetical protein [Gammaproteobacteria bacterium]NIV51943.1 hypothetical protein [Gammaproteobacteria bacterium]NIX86379.1 hypothetical protein [Gammaproteobacteria bacterium]